MIKNVNNVRPGNTDSQAPDFILHVDGNNPSPANFPGLVSGTTVMIAPGPYAVFETKPTKSVQYNVGYSSDCVGVINEPTQKFHDRLVSL